MIFAHSIIGLLPVDNSHFSWFWLLGSIVPDIDHIFIFLKNKVPFHQIAESMRFEERYELNYKTKYIHSIFGALVMSLPIALINLQGATLFFAAYIIHLVLDWPDIDEKEYFYPLKIKVKGFLPIFSKPERWFTAFLLVVTAFEYRKFFQ